MDRERAALYAGTIAAYADMYVTQSILPVLSAEFRVGAARAGLSVSAVVLAIAMLGYIFREARWVAIPLGTCVYCTIVILGMLADFAQHLQLGALARAFAARIGFRDLLD